LIRFSIPSQWLCMKWQEKGDLETYAKYLGKD